ncbi:hypothetical protein MAR_022295 [Mya arenaria]|uniref:Phytanoyl-CoA dioxygenase n=1 Tax=Mya arenaria TaxID=6604 RepID=A0ABY7DMH1_MYAAR|nr:hypothetical protein MAR_022295 [Mya arenaria]
MIEDVRFDGEFEVTDALKNQYDRDGFLIVRNLLDKEEIAQLWKIFEEPDGIMKHSYETSEPDDKKILRVMYRHPGNDVSGIISRSEKIVNACEKLLDGEVYHYHGKFIMKNPREGGQHLLKGSHKCGRINHVPGDATLQTGADLERVEALKPKCDVLFQHCNLLHTSEPNNSDMRRWAFVACYNKASNDSFLPHHHANYVPIEKVTNSAIKDCRNYTDFSGKDFTDPIKKEEDRMHFPPTEVKG